MDWKAKWIKPAWETGSEAPLFARQFRITKPLTSAVLRLTGLGVYEAAINGQRISLCGVPDPYAMINEDAPDTEVQLAQTMALTEAGTFTVLMAHRPELNDKYAAAGFDLVVSGHAHGGQVRIPGLLNGLYAPNQGILPSYAGGEYRIGEMALIVSRGLARESTRLPRVFNRPELVMIEIQ